MIPLIRSLSAPFLSLILLILASGLSNTFTSVRLEIEGYHSETVGFVTSALYAGIFVGSLWMDRWIAKLGHVRSFLLFAGATAILVLFQAAWIDPYYWTALRFMGGICTSGIFIVIESWLLMQATSKLRGAILSVYLAVFYGALSGGQLLIHISDPTTLTPFYIIALLSFASMLPLCFGNIQSPKMESATRLNTRQLFNLSPFGLSGVVISGVILAAVYGLVPVYARELGLSIPEIGNLMALLIFGGLIFQWPLGRLADKGKRRAVLLFASIITTILCCTIAISGHLSSTLLFLLIFLFGGFAFTIYPLSMAHACEKIEDHQLVSATGGFVLSYGVGAIVGPLMAPIAMNWMGGAGLFYFLAIIASVLVLVGLKKTKVV